MALSLRPGVSLSVPLGLASPTQIQAGKNAVISGSFALTSISGSI
jgi:hypothetical protein